MTSKKCQFSNKRTNLQNVSSVGILVEANDEGINNSPTMVEQQPSMMVNSTIASSASANPISITAATVMTPLISKLTPLNPPIPIADLKPDINACISSLKPVAISAAGSSLVNSVNATTAKISEIVLPQTPTSITALLPQHPEPLQPARPSSVVSNMSSGSSSSSSYTTPAQKVLTTISNRGDDYSNDALKINKDFSTPSLPLQLPALENPSLMAAAAAAAGAMALRNPLFLSPLILTASVNQLLLQQRRLQENETELEDNKYDPPQQSLLTNDEILRNVKSLIPQFPLLAPLLSTMAAQNNHVDLMKKTPGIADSFAEMYGENEVSNIRQLLDTINVSVTKSLLEDNLRKWGKDLLSGSAILEQLAHAQPLSPGQIFSSNNDSSRCGNDEVYGSEDEEDDEELVNYEQGGSKFSSAVSSPYSSFSTAFKNQKSRPIGNNVSNSSASSSSRVRTLISDEQVMVLKGHYNNNSKPKREELQLIADEIGKPFN